MFNNANIYRTKNLTIRYLIALSLVALLIILAYVLVLIALHRQASDAPVINLSGRQRMLSQKLTKEVLLLVQTQTPERREHYRELLRGTLANWSKVHNGLQYGNEELQLPGNNSEEVRYLFAMVDSYFHIIKRAVDRILSTELGDLAQLSPESSLVHDIVEASPLYLEWMDRVVFQYDNEAQKRVAILKHLETYIVVVVLLLLITVAVFIFRPMVNKVRRSYEDLQKANEQLSQDIIRRKRTEAERERLVKLKDEFISIATHDLKTPLLNIKGFASLIERVVQPGDTMTEETQKWVSKILRQADIIQGIVDDFLDFQALEDGQLKLRLAPTNVNEIARQVVENNYEYAKSKEMEVTLDLNGEVPEVSADHTRIEQVVENLVSNAVKFGPRGSRAVVRTVADGRFISLEVSDSGPGLTKGDLQKLFVKYAKLSSKPTGGERSIGLGLAICKELIELHEGEIGARNNPEVGVTFWFRLPVC